MLVEIIEDSVEQNILLDNEMGVQMGQRKMKGGQRKGKRKEIPVLLRAHSGHRSPFLHFLAVVH